MAQAQKRRPAKAEEPDAPTPDTSKAVKKGKQAQAKIDDVIDAVDDVLEKNAAEFIEQYQQRGGE